MQSVLEAPTSKAPTMITMMTLPSVGLKHHPRPPLDFKCGATWEGGSPSSLPLVFQPNRYLSARSEFLELVIFVTRP